MERTSFRGVHLEDADVSGAHLEHTDFRGANLDRANLFRAILTDAVF
ncbi:MAG: pentapeptide repeat-containing protein, partial [Gemmatimonadota bacterium]|nr:pentapeptide repeat-containing protein [Gemmatimonadota bacterium]